MNRQQLGFTDGNRQAAGKSGPLWLFFTAISFWTLFSVASVQALPGKKTVLVFSIEQGFVNSPVQNEDTLGLGRVASTLSQLKDRYDVNVTLGCAQSDQAKLMKALDIFSAAHIPFYLDAWSSDTIAPPRPADNPVSKPYDRSHGLCQSTEYLQTIRNRYGADFAGIRLHEVFAANLTVAMFHEGNNWFPHTSEFYPAGAYFQPKILEDEVGFASRNNMKVIFSDPYWLGDGNHYLKDPGVKQTENENALIDIMRRHPNTGMVMYANNEPLKSGPHPLYARIDNWSSLFPPALLKATTGFGLSDQAWVCDREKIPEAQCEPKIVAEWASKGIAQGATSFEFEPYWYFFDFPRPDGDNNNYTSYSDYEKRGTKTANYDYLIGALDRASARLVSMPAQQQKAR